MPEIALIVEGDGEVQALPILLRKLVPNVNFSRPLNAGGRYTLDTRLEDFLELLRQRPIDGVLILLDADERCAYHLATSLRKRVTPLSLSFPVAIVCAKSEYETWFLASIETLADKRGLPANLTFQYADVEAIRDAKGTLAALMGNQRTYRETTDQPAFSAFLDLQLTRTRSRSFRRLEHALAELLTGGTRVTP